MSPYSFDNWRTRLSARKQALKEAGKIDGEAALAESISDLLRENGLPPIQRTTVNHWLNGRNPPSMLQFIALCKALDIHPAEVFAGVPAGVVPLRSGMADHRIAETTRLMNETDDTGREIALNAVQVALSTYGKRNKKQLAK